METLCITSDSLVDIPTKNIPNESLQTFCYTVLLGRDAGQNKILLFVYSYDGLIFTSRKKCDYCAVRIQAFNTPIRMIIAYKAVSEVRRLVASLVDVKFMLGKVTLGPGFPLTASVFPVNTIPLMLHTRAWNLLTI
jgi:hypothetical protein